MEDPRDFTIFSELVVKLLDDSKGDIETALNPPSLTSEPNIINQYPWLINMLEVVIQNSLRLATFGKVKSRTPEQVSIDEAKLLGRQLAPFLLFSTTPKIAVDAWFKDSPVLIALDKETNGDFMNGVHIIVRNLKGNHGLRIRVTLGAILSVLDISSDIYMTSVFLSSEDESQNVFGRATLGMIAVCIFLQVVMALIQYASFSLSRKLLEIFYICTFLKPAVDAHRVGQANVDEFERLKFSPLIELQCNKLIETFAEGIPGAIVQTYALLANGFNSKAALVSVFVSALTTAFTNTTVCHDMDTNPKSRIQTPAFYGYFGDTQIKRFRVFVLLCISSCLMVCIKSLAYAMMMKTDTPILNLYLLVDFGLFFGVKLLRKDCWYAPIALTGPVAVFTGFIFRFTMKLNTDFMVLLQARHPMEMGGLWWIVNTCVGPVALIVISNFVYGDFQKFSIALSSAFVIFFAVFLANIETRYLKNFTSTMSGHKYTKNIFLNTTHSDRVRLEILTCTSQSWKSIRPQVKSFVVEKWESEWSNENTRPEWFRKRHVKLIPSSWINKPQQAKTTQSATSSPAKSSKVLPL
ncbi:hypothetical protein TrVE_jg13476 [Triparma verrucosa]|uniref:Uncharacterized protein n=1 Tax=Triparma verrucosa TaxID=1606542 RepID=A0A9W7BIV1_9STRA|nr:hypothetical protein TrVE_jg13476 [Triparma verrucosa]